MQIKRIIAVCAALLLTLSIVGCGSAGTSETGTENLAVQDTQEQTTNLDATVDKTEESSIDTDTKESDANAGGSNILIVYFSPANGDTVDAISAATPRVSDVSSVEYVARLISGQVDADMAKIVPKDPYPTVYEEAADQAKAEADENARPEFTLDVNPEDYDVIFVGYPIWWYHMPMIMQTFFDTYDFSGKTIIPFNNHAGSRDGGTYKDIAGLEPNATVLDGLAVSGERVSDAEEDVKDWLAGLGY